MKILQCIRCGTDVQLPSRSAVMRTYCSSKCRHEDKAIKKQAAAEPMLCLECKELLIPREDAHKQRNFCDKKCYQTWLRKDRKAKGLCTRCGTPAIEDQTLCEYHAQENSEKTKRLYDLQHGKPPRGEIPMLKIRPCEHCQQDYQPGRSNQRYCSKQCKKAAYTNKEFPLRVNTCVICHSQFETRRSYEITCSPECAQTNHANKVKENRPPVDNQPRKCEACGEEYPPGRNTQRYCTKQCKAAYRAQQRRHAEKASQDAKREHQRFLAEHNLCRICPPSSLHYAIPGRKACAFHTAVAQYNRGVQLGRIEDDWKPKRTDYTMIPFDFSNPLDEEAVEAIMLEATPASESYSHEEIMGIIGAYYARRTPDEVYWGDTPTPRELAAQGVGKRAQAALWMGRVPGNVFVAHTTGDITVSRWKSRVQSAANWE